MIGYKSILEYSNGGGGGGLDLDSLVITTPASKTVFKKNDPIDLTGLVVTGTIDNMTGDVTQYCTVTPSVFTTLGENTVTLSYRGLSVNYNVTVTNEMRIVPWATGTDLEIAAMLNAFYNDELDIYSCEGWEVGAEREVLLSAMPATGVGESHVAQTVKLRILDTNVRDLVTPINGHTKCAFVVGQGGLLKNGNTIETGYMHPTIINNICWEICDRRTWCNEVYLNALPSTLRGLFKQFVNPVVSKVNNSGGELSSTNDYFSLPSVNEIMPGEIGSFSWNPTNIREGSTLSTYLNLSEEYPRNKGGYYWFRTASKTMQDSFVSSSNTGYNCSFAGYRYR